MVFDHVKRVYNLALRIGKEEGADLDVLLIAALFHDVGREVEEYIGFNHAESSAHIVKDFFKERRCLYR